ncbi:hypothetical protein ACGF5O_44805 [Streptomyces sp. NPDC048291]|uniref:hypothetical protein n=1 Tax=Streptomyces sp. NPDC048291 TaxID=3365530 RepID=UPI00371B0FC8
MKRFAGLALTTLALGLTSALTAPAAHAVDDGGTYRCTRIAGDDSASELEAFGCTPFEEFTGSDHFVLKGPQRTFLCREAALDHEDKRIIALDCIRVA